MQTSEGWVFSLLELLGEAHAQPLPAKVQDFPKGSTFLSFLFFFGEVGGRGERFALCIEISF